MRTSERVVLAALVLAAGGCHRADPAASTRSPFADASGTAAADARIPCAGPGEAALTRTCTVDRAPGDGGQVLTLRRADGGFRRLTVTVDGRGVVASDGARPATVTITGANEIEVAVAGERYRLPATVKRAR